MDYGQFCPISKAAEVLGERWMLLVLRELIHGATRYTELQRGLGRISPSVLSARLKLLTEHGLIERVVTEENTREYRLTRAGRELGPVVHSIGEWGQRWMRSLMNRDELDVELLMVHISRGLMTDALAKKHTVIRFVFTDLRGKHRRWWLVVDGDDVELCIQAPTRPVDVTLTCRLKTLAQIQVGDTSVPEAVAAERLTVEGPHSLTRNLRTWLGQSSLAGVRPATDEVRAV
jgi:DNA-binding HxlR family transcriptional regulator/putative sterol carrier protein